MTVEAMVVNQVVNEHYALYNADSSEGLFGLPDDSIDFSIFSPPFSNLYTYSSSDRDLGNSRNHETFWQHFAYITSNLFRVLKPGRNIAVHVAEITTQKARDGEIGLYDFPGDTIRHFVENGFVFHGRIAINKNPQAQAVRNHPKALLFVQLRKDSSWSRPALADYILIFRKPGENAVPILPKITNNQWIQWAEPCWMDIKETDTLNAVDGRSDDDERHICPLQLGLIERCIKLWSNEGETVLSPFAGIGSELYEAIKNKRRGIGFELNPKYFEVAIKNLETAVVQTIQPTLFDD